VKIIYDETLKEYIYVGDRELITVSGVEAKPDYTLVLSFSNGEARIYDARPLLKKRIYKPLNDLSFFLSARAQFGGVIWNDEIDLGPEHLHETSAPVMH
jgi:hypothetical protein